MDEQPRQTALVLRAQQGDIDAFDRLVRQYQDMAVAYALAWTGDFHTAQDAAQEAFIEAFQRLGQLRQIEAFPGWLRQVVRTACHRQSRKNRLQTTPLDKVEAALPMPAVSQDERQDLLLAGLRSLPESERSTLALFYMSQYSHRDIARFLGVKETTVQGRLRTGRVRLKERMLKMAGEDLHGRAPSRDGRFSDRVKRMIRPPELQSDQEQPWQNGRGTDVWQMLTAAIEGDLKIMEKLVAQDSRLVHCSYQYRTPLHFAVQENRLDVVRFLLDQGADATYRSGNNSHERPLVIAQERGYEEMVVLLSDHLARTQGVDEAGEPLAAAIRDGAYPKVKALLDADPDLLEAGDARGNKAIHWAVMTRRLPIIDLVLERGANINAQRPDGARPLDLTNGDYFFRGGRDVPDTTLATHEVLIGYLIARGADYDMAVAAKIGDSERVRHLLEENASLANTVPAYSTYYTGFPLRNASAGHIETVKVLLEYGADPNTPEPGIAPQGGALHSAAGNGQLEIARLLLEKGADPNADVESSGNCMSIAGGNTAMIRLLASYGGTFPEWQDLGEVPAPALKEVYGEALPLRYYVYTGDIETLSSRIDQEPDLVGEILQTALGRQEGVNGDIVRLCLERDPNAAKIVHSFGLIYLLRRIDEDELLDIFRLLLQCGMTPNDPNWLQVTPLHLLSIGHFSHGSDGSGDYTALPKTMQLFIECGADLHARDQEFCSTPLGWAARWGRKEAVELLLQRGAQTNLPDDPDWATPLAWAQKKGHEEVEAILRQAGAQT
ncbi:MAG: sigma-70 family RNA polymerase sigma factor [Candidatus Latescibacteria bacterium]|nr:sigma-70 family RNA polymerase sigma factor [Candidatus Latescibacterota bacterium]